MIEIDAMGSVLRLDIIRQLVMFSSRHLYDSYIRAHSWQVIYYESLGMTVHSIRPTRNQPSGNVIVRTLGGLPLTIDDSMPVNEIHLVERGTSIIIGRVTRLRVVSFDHPVEIVPEPKNYRRIKE